MNWYIGQPIVAIRNHSQGIFKKGDEFTIKGLKQGCCSIRIDIGITYNLQKFCNLTKCGICNKITIDSDNKFWFSETCFAPLDINISELTDILKEPVPCNTHYHAM